MVALPEGVSGFDITCGPNPVIISVGPGCVTGLGRTIDFPGGTINLHSGVALAGRDDSPPGGGWVYLYLLQHKRSQTRTCLVMSSSPVTPVLVSRCFRGIKWSYLVGAWPLGGIRGTRVGGLFSFQHPQLVEVEVAGPVQLDTPGISLRERVVVMVMDKTGHGTSVFDGDLVDPPDPPVGPIHTPVGGPPSTAVGTVVAVEGRVVLMMDLADSGMAEVDLYLCGVHL